MFMFLVFRTVLPTALFCYKVWRMLLPQGWPSHCRAHYKCTQQRCFNNRTAIVTTTTFSFSKTAHVLLIFFFGVVSHPLAATDWDMAWCTTTHNRRRRSFPNSTVSYIVQYTNIPEKLLYTVYHKLPEERGGKSVLCCLLIFCTV